ncbi:hypothetical protein CJD44_00900 [Streptomyces sp. alain-838]|nr:hypothetical protein CJD44_00900 [Streptomyces sp. alain-838]
MPEDCRVVGGTVAELGTRLARQHGEAVVDGLGGALLPGLADHHVHLGAMAARARSVDAAGLSRSALGRALAGAAVQAGGWVRVIGYDDVAHGALDRPVLDMWRNDVPVKVQHRSGALWVVNSAGLRALGPPPDSPGVERDAVGLPTGRLWRCDAWLRGRGDEPPPDLREVGARLASYGITRVTDATPDPGPAELLAGAVERGELPQRVMSMASAVPTGTGLVVGPVKLVVTDHALPDLADLIGRIRDAHGAGRAVAVHCVTRTALALTLAALDAAGTVPGDRVEHCAVADPAAVGEVAARGLRVVTQPTLVTLRGDDYWDRSEPIDRPDLWRYGSLLRAGVRAAPASDAPYGDPDPWACLRAAAERRTAGGRVLGARERVPPSRVLKAMLAPLADPGGLPRRVVPEAPADLILLDRPLVDALRAPDARHVRLTMIGGRLVHGEGADR